MKLNVNLTEYYLYYMLYSLANQWSGDVATFTNALDAVSAEIKAANPPVSSSADPAPLPISPMNISNSLQKNPQ